MLETPEHEIAGIISFASLTDVVAVAMDQLSAQHHAFIVEIFLKMVTLSLQSSEYFADISICFVTEKFLAIQLWVENFRKSASALRKKPPGSVSSVQSHQKFQAVNESSVQTGDILLHQEYPIAAWGNFYTRI
jgi:hypothetical protein